LTICRRRFLARSAPAKFLATVEAADAEAAVEAAAKEFKADPKRLIAVRRAEAGRLVSLVHWLWDRTALDPAIPREEKGGLAR
jgi:hypothetical protein